MLLLVLEQLCKPAALLKQGLPRSILQNHTVLQYHNPVRQGNIGQAVGGKEHRFARCELSQLFKQPVLGLRVQIGGGLVQDQRRVPAEKARAKAIFWYCPPDSSIPFSSKIRVR